MIAIKNLFAGIFAVGFATIGFTADAGYPSKPIRLVVPYPAGGAADNIARLFSRNFSEVMSTPVIVDNKPGASGTIGAEAVAKGPKDGYTLLLTVTTQLTNAGLNVKPNYEAVRDFTPIVGLCIAPAVFVVSASLPVKTLADLAALAKNTQLNYGSYGAGTSNHIMQYLLGRQFKAKDMVHVPYKGESPMVVDLLGGQVQMGMVSVGVAREMEKSGKLRPLAVVGPTRSEFLPKVPTFQELGYRNLDWTYGVAVYAPSMLPPDIQEKLEMAGKKVMASPQVQQAYRAQSNQPWSVTPEDLKKRMVIDSVLWNKVLGQIGNIE